MNKLIANEIVDRIRVGL